MDRLPEGRPIRALRNQPEIAMLRNLNLRRPLAILDLETTGVRVDRDRIVEISVLKLMPGAESVHHTRRLNPEMPIPPEATRVHGISDSDVANEPTFSEIAYRLLKFLDDCDLCGYNLRRFDLRMLYHEFQRVGLEFDLEERAIIDPMQIFHHYERRDLSSAVRFYLGTEHVDAHGAKADVLATANVLEAMLDRYSDLPRSVSDLHVAFATEDFVDSSEMFVRHNGNIHFRKGKYRGMTLDAVAKAYPGYLDWMVNEGNFNSDTKKIVADIRPRANDATV